MATPDHRRPRPRRRRLPNILSLAAASLSLPSLAAAQQQPLPCARWAHMTTIAGSKSNTTNSSTLYIYGGQAKTSPDQTQNTWTNALLSLDLSTGWNAGAPPLQVVQPDSGDPYDPPAVALGALWAGGPGGNTLYQYGGQFSDSPYVSPGGMGVVSFDTASSTGWTNATTQNGNGINRVSEGGTAVVPGSGQGGSGTAFYGFGHLDWASVEGWSRSTPRVFLGSMVSFDLGSLTWTNLTSYATNGNTGTSNSTAESAPTIRADGTLTYVPSMGTNKQGLLVAIGGGQNYVSNDQNTNRSIDNSALDVFDIGSNSWTKQATQGDVPSPRVNHCAVRGTAKIAGVPHSQIFIYGGQVVNGTQQSTDLYILSLPSFTWTQVPSNSSSSQPTGRAGHTCDLIGSQMVVVGGYVSDSLLCDSQSVYVLDVASLAWQPRYKPGTLFQTPQLVAGVNGGVGTGSSTSGSGSTIGGDGSADPDTSKATSSGSGNGGSSGGTLSGGGNTNSSGSGGGGGSNAGAIAGGVVGGLAALALLLLGMLLWRRSKRKESRRREEEALAAAREKEGLQGGGTHARYPSGGYWDGDSGGVSSSDEHHHGFNAYPPASDDPEGHVQGYEAQFSTRLTPRQQLRIVNPSPDE